MNKKFCFIIVYNDESCLNECLSYIDHVNVPDGFEIDLLTVNEVNSMAEGYQEAMKMSDAQFKIYMHQDTFIVNKDILIDLDNLFESDSKIGAIGISGSISILGNDISLASEVYGKPISIKYPSFDMINYSRKKNEWEKVDKDYIELNCLSGFFIATRYDVDWEELIQNDWRYYGVIHSLELLEKGYKLIVPKNANTWCIHDGNNQGLFFSKDTIVLLSQRFGKLIPSSVNNRVLICDTDQISYPTMDIALYRIGYYVENYCERIKMIDYSEEAVERLTEWLKLNEYSFVFTFDFSRSVAEACHRANVKYLSWAWDSPLLPYYYPEAKYETTWALMFDNGEIAQLEQLGIPNIRHIPLASNEFYSTSLIIDRSDEIKYSHDISFVGGLYSNKVVDNLDYYFTGDVGKRVKNIFENETCVWADWRKLYDMLDDEMMEMFYEKQIQKPEDNMCKAFFQVQMFQSIAHVERVKILNALASKFRVDLYTKGNSDELINVNVHGPVNSMTEAPKVFHLSKINLNITLHSIKTGVPLRIFEIMGVGGFTISNYQEELAELFEEDKEIVMFRDIDELMDKVQYYLLHDRQRNTIAHNGYKKIKKEYSYDVVARKILKSCEIPWND